MKVKDLIKKLEGVDRNAVVVFSEYVGGPEPLREVATLIVYEKGQHVADMDWDGNSWTDSVKKDSGLCKTSVVILKTSE